MGEIKVAFAALEAARADVVGTATRIAGRLDDLRRAVVPLAVDLGGAGRAGVPGPATAVGRRGGGPHPGARRTSAGRSGEAEAGYRAAEAANANLWRARMRGTATGAAGQGCGRRRSPGG